MGDSFYCVKCKERTSTSGAKVVQTKNGRYRLVGTCDVCGITKSKFVSRQQAKGLLSMLGIRTPLSKIPIIGDLLF